MDYSGEEMLRGSLCFRVRSMAMAARCALHGQLPTCSLCCDAQGSHSKDMVHARHLATRWADDKTQHAN